MSANDPRRTDEPISVGAATGIAFAGTILLLAGTFQLITGLVAIIDDEFYVRTANYTFDLDVSAWGWIHLLGGVALLAVGFGLFSGSEWAGVAALVIAGFSAIANFFFIPYYPIWSLVIIALDVWVIWALARPGALRD